MGKLIADGFHASGQGAHEAEVAYLRNLGVEEKEVRFMNALRSYRNGILYYSKTFNAAYAQQVLELVNTLYPLLLKLQER